MLNVDITKRKKLLQVQTTFRHGSRTPMGSFGVGQYLTNFTKSEQDLSIFNSQLCQTNVYFPLSRNPINQTRVPRNYPGESTAPLPGGGLTGALTCIGMKQALRLGNELSARYVGMDKLLPSSWSQAKRFLTTRSTYTKRTLATARGVLSGLYPDDAQSGTMSADIDLSGQPEHQVFHRSSCNRLKQVFATCMAKHVTDVSLEKIQAVLRDQTTQWSHADPMWEIISARDQFACREAEGKPIPPEILAIDHELNVAATLQMHHIFIGDGVLGQTEALKMAIGRMVTVIMDTMEKPDGKLHLYSGHDWTVTPLLLTACREKEEPAIHTWPPFCSNISFELWSDRDDDVRLNYWGTRGIQNHDQGRYVRTIYNSNVIDMPCSPRGEEYCTLRQFRHMMNQYKSLDYNKECKEHFDGCPVVTLPGLSANHDDDKSAVEARPSSA
jgi:hypothetical protein